MEYYGSFVLKFMIGFFVVITYFNLSGKTQLAQLTPVDFIGNFVLGGIIGGVIYTDSIPYAQYITVLLIGICMMSTLNIVSKRIHAFRSLTIGEPIPIIKKGQFLMENILEKRNKIDILNVSSQIHAQGVCSFQEIYYAQIEPNGQITVVCDEAKMPSLIIMKEGKARGVELKEIEKDEAWLDERVSHNQLDRDEIFIAEFWDGNTTFIMKDGSAVKDSADRPRGG